MSNVRVPADLLRQVEADMRPVRPLASPTRRALVLVPLAILLVVGMPMVWGFRGDFGRLSAAVAWGLSALQALAGLVVAGAALREAVPGRALSTRAIVGLVGLTVATVVGVTMVTDAEAATVSPNGVWMRFVWECWEMAVISALPGVVVMAWLATRALPARPAITGAIYGLGAAMIADSGVRLFCWVSEPSHVLIAHGGAIVAMTIIGALMSIGVERARARLTSEEHV